MVRPYSRRSLLALGVPLVAASVAMRSRAAAAPDGAVRYADTMGSRFALATVAGPMDGRLTQEEDIRTAHNPLELKDGLEDFTATATFVNPSSLDNVAWDYGLSFRWSTFPDGTLEQEERVVITSDGWCYYAPYGVEPLGDPVDVPNFDNTPGAMTTIDLWVAGQEALVGVNGNYLVTLGLQSVVTSGVATGTGYFPETRQPGREIVFQRFEVWNLW